MTTKEWFDVWIGVVNTLILVVTGGFIFRSLYSPVDAVKIGRQLNNEQQKDSAKRSLFLTLFSLRGSPLNYDFVIGLNQIDVVFEDTPSVLEAWHIHYDSLNTTGQVDATKIWDLQRTNLLSAMAQSLGYERIRQTDMLKNYTPIGHENMESQLMDMEEARLNYYKSNYAMNRKIMERMDNQDTENEEK
jgi:hypothetical protein